LSSGILGPEGFQGTAGASLGASGGTAGGPWGTAGAVPERLAPSRPLGARAGAVVVPDRPLAERPPQVRPI
jgi:hypothetical protein